MGGCANTISFTCTKKNRLTNQTKPHTHTHTNTHQHHHHFYHTHPTTEIKVENATLCRDLSIWGFLFYTHHSLPKIIHCSNVSQVQLPPSKKTQRNRFNDLGPFESL